eukprot:TRINITY_DN6603_c0_g1_i2.p2 TRINITY_DN6603_c0_g1~~TRINITY_DN6603_c0_g1_i2.p2  ORF type:complete len:113 (-),score=1.55 TRINITY_DN6603_c0_g1_i2:219-557(-)
MRRTNRLLTLFDPKGKYVGNLAEVIKNKLDCSSGPFLSIVEHTECFELTLKVFEPRGRCAQPCMHFQYAIELLAKSALPQEPVECTNTPFHVLCERIYTARCATLHKFKRQL